MAVLEISGRVIWSPPQSRILSEFTSQKIRCVELGENPVSKNIGNVKNNSPEVSKQ